jgi:hypothetical protein
MIVRDNAGKVVGQLEHFRDAQGNTVDANTTYDSSERPRVQQITGSAQESVRRRDFRGFRLRSGISYSPPDAR